MTNKDIEKLVREVQRAEGWRVAPVWTWKEATNVEYGDRDNGSNSP
jgi:hypothetical protein